MQKVMRGGQITLTKEIRQKLNIREGDYIQMALNGSDVVINALDVKAQVRMAM